MKYSVEEPLRLILFVRSTCILYMLYKYGASRVQNLITVYEEKSSKLLDTKMRQTISHGRMNNKDIKP